MPSADVNYKLRTLARLVAWECTSITDFQINHVPYLRYRLVLSFTGIAGTWHIMGLCHCNLVSTSMCVALVHGRRMQWS